MGLVNFLSGTISTKSIDSKLRKFTARLLNSGLILEGENGTHEAFISYVRCGIVISFNRRKRHLQVTVAMREDGEIYLADFYQIYESKLFHHWESAVSYNQTVTNRNGIDKALLNLEHALRNLASVDREKAAVAHVFQMVRDSHGIS